MNYNDFELTILDMLYNPYGPNGLEEPTNEQKADSKYILEYCNEYYHESDPETLYHEWIQLIEGNDSIILEICMEPYMRIIERVTGNIVIQHPIQREIINIEGDNK